VNAEEHKEWLTASQLAKRLHVTPRSVWRWGQKRQIDYVTTPFGYRLYSSANFTRPKNGRPRKDTKRSSKSNHPSEGGFLLTPDLVSQEPSPRFPRSFAFATGLELVFASLEDLKAFLRDPHPKLSSRHFPATMTYEPGVEQVFNNLQSYKRFTRPYRKECKNQTKQEKQSPNMAG
jgi:hypothetical protein